jgi:hypothetical protein
MQRVNRFWKVGTPFTILLFSLAGVRDIATFHGETVDELSKSQIYDE